MTTNPIDLTGTVTVTTGDVMEVVVPDTAPDKMTATLNEQVPVVHAGKPVQERRSSPSKYRSVELSPAFVQDPTRPEHPTTAEGKLLHRALETGDLRGLTENQLRLVGMCAEYVNHTLPQGTTRKHEMKFPIVGQDYGYGDLVGIKGNKGWYIDYKFGFGKQEDVEVNPAAQAYALGMMTVFPYLTSVECHYMYPRLEEISVATFKQADLPRIVARITAIKERHNAATPETCSYHEDTCVYCTHLGKCPTAAKALLPLAQKYADTHEMEVPVVPDLSAIRDPETWARIYRGLPALEALVGSIKRHALEFRQESGIEIPGTALREKKGARSILSPLGAWEVAKTFGVSQEAFLGACSVSVSDLIKEVRDLAPRGKKDAVEQQLECKLSDVGVLTQGASSWHLARSKT